MFCLMVRYYYCIISVVCNWPLVNNALTVPCITHSCSRFIVTFAAKIHVVDCMHRWFTMISFACLTVLSIYVPNEFNLIFVVIFKYCSLNLLRLFFRVIHFFSCHTIFCYSLSAALSCMRTSNIEQERNIFHTRKYILIYLYFGVFIIMCGCVYVYDCVRTLDECEIANARMRECVRVCNT